MYYLSLRDIVLKSQYTEVDIVIDDTIEEVQRSLDADTKVVTLTIKSDTTYGELPDYFILKNMTRGTDTCQIEPGAYHLWKSIDINGFEFVLSDDSINMIFNQYVLDYKPKLRNEILQSHDAINIRINYDMRIPDYVDMINCSQLFYILSVREDAFLGTVYGQCLDRANRIIVSNQKVVTPKNDHLLVEEADYITALILKLRKEYPHVQFYNQDQDRDDSRYCEFVRYKPLSAQYGGDMMTTPVFHDEIYGSIIYTTCQMEFEYHCPDIALFNRRKFDYQINRFLSNVTTNIFQFPQKDTKMQYTVYWDRDNTSQGYDYTANVDLDAGAVTQYSFSSNVRLFVTLYRLANYYPIIKKVIIQDPVLGSSIIVSD